MTREEQRRNQQLPGLDAVEEGVILALWRQGLDTFSIAKHLGRPECLVANRLLHIRDAA